MQQREKAKPEDDGSKDPTRPSHWFTIPRGADNVVRRRHAWGLLGWYHETVVKPNMGLAGFFRRCWWRITGNVDQLRSPWEKVDAAIAMREQREALEAAAAAKPAIEPTP